MRVRTIVSLVLGLMVAVAPSSAQQPGDSRFVPGTATTQSARAQVSYGRLPLRFEANQGQTDSQVRFLSRGNGYTAYLTAGGMVLALRPPLGTTQSGNIESPARARLELKLVGAAQEPSVVGEGELAGKVNYFIGNNPAKWHTNVATYGKVRYRSVYPGIDLVYYGNHQQMEYDFEIAPGADPRRIQFEIRGASQVDVDAGGNLILKTAAGDLNFASPLVYQKSGGQRVPVHGGYIVKDPQHVGFKIGNYDSNEPVVIDPVLVYSTYLGGTGNDQPVGIAVDSAGSIYVAGYTDSVDFPLATLGSLPSSTNHVFIAKLDPSGSNLVYADYIGGNSQDYAAALVLDASSNVYVTGSTASSDFPMVNAFQQQQPGPYSGFLAKVSANGSSLLSSTYLGGDTFDQPTGLAIDNLGQAHVAGFTLSRNFPVANAYQNAASANQGGVYGSYGFLTTFSPNGSGLIYSTYLAGNTNVVQDCGSPCWPTPYNVVNAIAVDASGNTYLAGATNTYNFPVTAGAYQASNITQQDATVGFVSKFNSVGALAYSTYLYGSSGNPVGMGGIAVDAAGNAYVTGGVSSDDTFPITSTGICDTSVYGSACSYAFVAKLDATGSSLLYSTFLGPNNFATPQSIALDSSGDAYVLASTFSALFQTNSGIESYSNNSDLLLVEIDPTASTQLFSTYLGGSGNDFPSGMALDAAGNIYVAGATGSSDMPLTETALQGRLGGNTDAFIMKIASNAAPFVSLNPTALQFPARQVGLTSPQQQLVLRNMGSSSLSLSSITTTGDFAESDNCGGSVPPSASCTFSVTFSPTAAGVRSGSIRINDDAAGSPHMITLSGTGLGAAAGLAPGSLSFGTVRVGTSSSALTVTLSNSGNSTLNISSIQVSGDYAQSNNCSGTLATGSSCAINVTFTPTASGSRSGTLTVTDSASGSPHTASLTGTGSDFTLSAASSSVTVKAGVTATYTLTVTPQNGAFPSAINLGCTGAPALTTCSLSSSSVTPGSNPATVTLTISTTAARAELERMPFSPSGPYLAASLQLQGFGVFGMILMVSKRSSRKGLILIALVGVIAAMLFMTACAGGTGIAPVGTTPGTYPITVTATSGALQHSLPLSLTVQ